MGILGSSCVRPRTRIIYYCEHPSCWPDGRNRGSLCPQSSRAGDTRLNASPSLASHSVPECITCARLRPLVEVILQHRCLDNQLRTLYQFGQGPLLLQRLLDPHAQVPVHADPHGAALAALLLCQPPHLLDPVARLAALPYEAQASLGLQTFDIKPRLPELLTYLPQGGQPRLF